MNVNTTCWSTSTATEREAALSRPSARASLDCADRVRAIIARVAEQGDAALRHYARKFDGVDTPLLRVSTSGFVEQIDAGLASAMAQAIANLRAFHGAQLREPLSVEVMPGMTCSRRSVPVQRVGLYVPGGSAPLPSTLLMLGVPALLAGCSEVVVCTPPSPSGVPDASILAASELLGIEHVYVVGGAQAVAAMAMGTQSVPKVDKIFGPGNIYVMEAKSQVSALPSGPAIDMPAGPSEVLVVADAHADASFVAADLLAQAEHDALAHCVLISNSAKLIEAVQREVSAQVESLERSDVASQSLSRCRWILAASLDEAMQCSNAYAPEHLIIHSDEAERLGAQVVNAGSVFLGPWTPEALGDYASGTNHVLPTGGTARAYSGISMDSFQKQISFQRATPQALLALEECVTTLADAEGLGAHAQSVRLRCTALRRAAQTGAAS